MEQKPINISDINITEIGTIYAYLILLNFIPAKIAIAVMGTKLGG